ncbi:MAG: UvrD-helicase domain-containing protein [Planctomycetia bacterium]|nr:UvrD-helicase domain-containing protein [Planctomycetia bacterium]
MAGDLNPGQHEAVRTLSGPMLVLAGAGTGKTRVVTFRIAELIRRRIRPARILAVTFTNKAAAEMRERSAALLGKKLRESPEISTFHSLCVRVLRRHIARLGYPEKFSIYDSTDQEGVARQSLREINVPGETLRPGDLLYLIGQWKSKAVRADDAESVATTDREHLAAAAYRRYQATLRAAGAVDFDDLLLLTEDLFSRFDDVRKAEAGRFDHLLIDEYQDTNASQYRIVKALAAPHRNLCVVGDDDQSIYGFRGAEVAHILRFTQDWPDAKLVRLEENYRSRPEILHLANTLIVCNKHRHEKVLRASRSSGERPRILQFQDETDEAHEVVADIKKSLVEWNIKPRDVAILFRTNEQPRAFETELRQANVPYVLVGGMSFFDRKEVRDVLAYFKLIAQPNDEVALLRIINTPPRGISQPTVNALMAEATKRGCPLTEVLADPAGAAGVNAAAVEAIGLFQRFVDDFRERLKIEEAAKRNKKAQVEPAIVDEAPAADAATEESAASLTSDVPQGVPASLHPVGLVAWVHDLLRTINYRSEIMRAYKEPRDQETRWQSIEEVVNSIGNYARRAKRPTLSGFLEEVAMNTREQESDKEGQLERNAVALMTLHSAKGLEFPHVYLVGLEEGLLPHRRAIEEQGDAIDEERRLCYVGLTRARERLTLTMALSRMKWGKARESVPSRFLYELTGQANHPNAEAAREGLSPSQRKALNKKKKPSGAKKKASPKVGEKKRAVAPVGAEQRVSTPP